MSTFEDRVALGIARAKTRAGNACTIIRGGNTGSSTAVLGRTEYRSQDEEGTQTKQHVQDLLIDAADYNLGGETTQPRSGDEFTITINSTARRFECRTPPGFDTPWEWSGPGRTRYRVHVVEIPTT